MGKSKQNIQKVRVMNFPAKSKYDRLQMAVAILSLTVAVISLAIASISTFLYINEISKSPDIYVSVHSPTPVLHKTVFEFKNDTLSEPLEFSVSLHNKGKEKSESLARFVLMFDKDVEVSLKSGDFWKVPQVQSYKTFNYRSDDLVINPHTNRFIASFNLSVPKQKERLLLAHFIIEGDFRMKSGLIYYDYLNEKYSVDHFTDPDKSVELWNKHIAKH